MEKTLVYFVRRYQETREGGCPVKRLVGFFGENILKTIDKLVGDGVLELSGKEKGMKHWKLHATKEVVK